MPFPPNFPPIPEDYTRIPSSSGSYAPETKDDQRFSLNLDKKNKRKEIKREKS
jgi:hypothetical protein